MSSRSSPLFLYAGSAPLQIDARLYILHCARQSSNSVLPRSLALVALTVGRSGDRCLPGDLAVAFRGPLLGFPTPTELPCDAIWRLSISGTTKRAMARQAPQPSASRLSRRGQRQRESTSDGGPERELIAAFAIQHRSESCPTDLGGERSLPASPMSDGSAPMAVTPLLGSEPDRYRSGCMLF